MADDEASTMTEAHIVVDDDESGNFTNSPVANPLQSASPAEPKIKLRPQSTTPIFNAFEARIRATEPSKETTLKRPASGNISPNQGESNKKALTTSQENKDETEDIPLPAGSADQNPPKPNQKEEEKDDQPPPLSMEDILAGAKHWTRIFLARRPGTDIEDALTEALEYGDISEDKSYTDGDKIYLAFASEDAWNRSSAHHGDCITTKGTEKMDYNPQRTGTFYRIYASSKEANQMTYEKLCLAINELSPEIQVKSLKISNSNPSFTFYTNTRKNWLKIINRTHFIDRSKSRVKQFPFFRILRSFCGTNESGLFKLFIGGVPQTVTHEGIEDILLKYGIKVVLFGTNKEKGTNKTKGYGFAFVEGEEAITRAIKLAEKKAIHFQGRAIHFAQARNKNQE